jgi:hypothetical protein
MWRQSRRESLTGSAHECTTVEGLHTRTCLTIRVHWFSLCRDSASLGLIAKVNLDFHEVFVPEASDTLLEVCCLVTHGGWNDDPFLVVAGLCSVLVKIEQTLKLNEEEPTPSWVKRCSCRDLLKTETSSFLVQPEARIIYSPRGQ